jgi:hypothetical protein
MEELQKKYEALLKQLSQCPNINLDDIVDRIINPQRKYDKLLIDEALFEIE